MADRLHAVMFNELTRGLGAADRFALLSEREQIARGLVKVARHEIAVEIMTLLEGASNPAQALILLGGLIFGDAARAGEAAQPAEPATVDVEAIKARLKGLPQAPWHVEGRYPQRISNPAALVIAECFESPQYLPAIAPFIAACREDMPALVDEVERLQVVEIASVGAHALLNDAEDTIARLRTLGHRLKADESEIGQKDGELILQIVDQAARGGEHG